MLPRLAIPLPPAGTTLDPATLFAAPKRAYWLEIGFGGGEHLAALAARHRDVGFLGCEPFINGAASLLVAIDRDALDNVRVLMDDARLLLAALPDRSLDRVDILFPDPWPKTRHHRRRMVSAAVIAHLARVIRPGGHLHLATDHEEYGAWMLRHMLDCGDFRWLATTAEDWRRPPADEPPTRYQQKALARGAKPIYLNYERV